MDGWLSGPGAYLRSGAEMAEIFARYPGVVAQSIEIADQLRLQSAAGQATAAQTAGPR